jgi:hypothetical protein
MRRCAMVADAEHELVMAEVRTTALRFATAADPQPRTEQDKLLSLRSEWQGEFMKLEQSKAWVLQI